MALNTITPSNREEEYLSAIAGDEGASAPVPSNRREEWLRRIAEGQGDQTRRLDHIEDQLPIDPTSDDVGKVMTVVADESGEEPVYKWSAESAQGGGGTFYVTGTLNNDRWFLNASYQNIADAIAGGKTVIGVFDNSEVGSVSTKFRQLESITYAAPDSYRALFSVRSSALEFSAATATANLAETIY